MIFLGLALSLSLGPYAGPPSSGNIPGTAKFGVTVSGRPGSSVRLRTVGIPRDFVASFCTNRVCAPFRVSFVLPASGRQTIELQLVAKTAAARPPTDVVVELDESVRRSIRFSHAAHQPRP